jgi:hypothetical protein
MQPEPRRGDRFPRTILQKCCRSVPLLFGCRGASILAIRAPLSLGWAKEQARDVAVVNTRELFAGVSLHAAA